MALGINVKQLAQGAIEKSQLIDPSIFGWESPSQDKRDDTPSAEVEVPSVSDIDAVDRSTELADNLVANDSLESEPTSIEMLPTVAAQPVEMSQQQREAATKAYWNSFADCARSEFHGRWPEIQYANWQLLDYLIHRQQGHEQVLKSLKQLETQGVDARLLDHSAIVFAWHKSGEELFAQAVNLLTNGPRAQLTGPFAQSWQSAATQHRMEEKLVRKKHRVTAGYLNHTYEALAPFVPAFP